MQHPPMQFLPAKALKLLENVLELKLRKLQKIILKLVTTTSAISAAEVIGSLFILISEICRTLPVES